MSEASGFRLFEHTADFGIEAWGPDEQSMFQAAARGLFESILDPETVRETRSVEVAVQAEGLDLLLRAWLSELLYLFSAKGMAVRRFQIHEMDAGRLRATVYGEPFDESRHGLRSDAKAITYHQLFAGRESGLWRGRVIVDV